MDYSSIATGQLYVVSDKIPEAEDNEHGDEESFKRDDPNANALPLKSWSKPLALIVILESYFEQYLDLSKDNNACFQMKMVYVLLKHSYTYSDPKKAPRTPKKGKDKSSDRDDLVSIVGPTFKNKNLIEALKGKGLSKKHKQSLCLVWFVHNVLWARDVNNNISLDLINLFEDLEVHVIVEATAEEHNITVDNPSTSSKEEKKVEPVSLEERKNYPFEGFNISDEDPKKLTQLINDYSEWIIDRLLKHHAGRRHSGPSSEIQKLAKILPTYLDMSGFLDQKVHTDWSTIEAYQDKMANLFDVQYFEGIAQQTIGSLDCGPFVAAYVEYLSDGSQVPNDGLDAGLLHKIYAALLWKYGEAKDENPYATDIKDPRRPKPNFIAPDEEQLVHID
ncbi:hypothetical protein BC332_24151 [Capsicum chinense]|nr:hypothetical protein BC332_24151 [Capsicum chinense]